MNAGKYNVDLLMQRIEDEVLYRRAQLAPPITEMSSEAVIARADSMASGSPAPTNATLPPAAVHLNLPTRPGSSAEAPFPVNPDASYHLDALLPYDDVEFVHAAFRAILQREVDEDGLRSYLAMLREGASKTEILGRLRESAEGTLRGARIHGLGLAYLLDTISRWPFIGKLFGIVLAVWNLPNAQRHQRRQSNEFSRRITEMHDRIADLTNTVYTALGTLENSHNTLSGMTGAFAGRTETEAVQRSMIDTTAALRTLQATVPHLVDQRQLNQEMQALRARMETKAGHALFNAVSMQVESFAQAKADRTELQQVAMEFGALVSAMGSTKADSTDLAAAKAMIDQLAEGVAALDVSKADSDEVNIASRFWNERLDEMAATKADDSALRAVRMEGRSGLKAAMGQAMEFARGIAQSKASQSGVDALKRASMDAIKQMRVQWEHRLGEVAATVQDDQVALQAVREEGKSSLIAATNQTMDAIRGIARSKADQSRLEALRQESTLAIEQARGQWTVRFDEVAAIVKDDQNALQALREEGKASLIVATDKTMEAMRGIAQLKADQSSLDALRQEAMDVIERVRVQWAAKWDEVAAIVKGDQLALQAVREEGARALTAVADQAKEAISGIAQSKADQTGLDALGRQSTEALEQARVQWNARLEEVIAIVTGDQLALQAVREEGAAALTAVADQAKEAIRGIAQSKADQSVVDALKKESMGAIEQMRFQASRAMETKAERHEITALTNHFVALLQQRPTSKELSAVADAVTKAGNAEVARLKAIEALGLEIQSLDQTKADQASIAALQAETKVAMVRASEKLSDALRPVISRAEELRRSVLDQERRIALLLEEARKRFPEPISADQIGVMLTEEDHQLDATYASLEDQFRGTRTDIRNRQSIYLPYIRGAKAGTGTAPIVDLGCGRGEWLELLASEGMSARGVDRNRIFLAVCRELNLEVVDQDVMKYLRQLAPNSVGAVTAFHLIEHLAHRTLIALIDEILRVLMPGGIVIFETPNPTNLIVSACHFYLDPTHRHPLPPDLSRHLLEARGFCDVKMTEMHPFGSEHQILEGDEKVKNSLNQYFFSAQDYAVIGRKA